MEVSTMKNFIKKVLKNRPTDWLNLTTHRLDIYNEELAKSQFLTEFKNLFSTNNSEASSTQRVTYSL